MMSLESPSLAEHVLMEPIRPLHLFQWGWEQSRAAFLVPRYMYEFPTSQMDTQKAGELELSCKYQGTPEIRGCGGDNEGPGVKSG